MLLITYQTYLVVPTAVGLACSRVMLGRYLSVVMLLCRSCSLFTIHYPLFSAHYSSIHCFSLHWSFITSHLYHCSLFTELEWHHYTSTETQCRVPTPVRLAVAKLWQRQSYGICILMSIGLKLWNYMSTWGAPGTHCRAGTRQLSCCFWFWTSVHVVIKLL